MAASSSTAFKAKLIAYTLLPVILYCIPLERIREGDTLCLFHNLTGHDCYGCGMTRALFSMLHLDFAAAWNFNKLVVIVTPLLLYLYIKGIVGCIRRLSVKQDSGHQ